MSRYDSIRAVEDFEEYLPYYEIEFAREQRNREDLDTGIREVLDKLVKYADEVIGTHRLDYY